MSPHPCPERILDKEKPESTGFLFSNYHFYGALRFKVYASIFSRSFFVLMFELKAYVYSSTFFGFLHGSAMKMLQSLISLPVLTSIRHLHDCCALPINEEKNLTCIYSYLFRFRCCNQHIVAYIHQQEQNEGSPRWPEIRREANTSFVSEA